MRGPAPTPAHLRVLRGNPSKRPIPREPEPTIPAELPEPPPFLTGYARDEWLNTGPELYRLGLLTRVDINTFAAFCQAYKHWRTAVETLETMAKRDPLTGGLMIKTPGGDAGINPLLAIARHAAGQMVSLAAHFGLSPAARARIAAGVSDYTPPSKFEGLPNG
jgi:P27 family predicted phage terminase small subunit